MTEDPKSAAARHDADMGQQAKLGKQSLARDVASGEQLAEVGEASRVGIKEIKYVLYIAIACLLLMIGVSAYAWSQVRTIGADVRNHTEQLVEIGKTNRANTTLLIDCTTPEGECFQRSQERTAKVVSTLNTTTVAAVYCSKALPTAATVAQVQTCVEQIIAADLR